VDERAENRSERLPERVGMCDAAGVQVSQRTQGQTQAPCPRTTHSLWPTLMEMVVNVDYCLCASERCSNCVSVDMFHGLLEMRKALHDGHLCSVAPCFRCGRISGCPAAIDKCHYPHELSRTT
jgi:hypothetical protein